VPLRLRDEVEGAVHAFRRWQQVTATLVDGPLAERLGELGAQVQAGVLELYALVVRIGEVERVVGALDPDGATAAYKAARRRAADGHPPPELDALEARFQSIQRMLNVVADAEVQVRVIDARLLAAVSRGAELVVTADPRGLTTMSADLDGVVAQLDAARRALASFG
jgi:peptidoglycan hydrolase-like protein with peptidoglycan-binding domain